MWTLQYFQKKFKAHENIKKWASKVAHNRPQTFFHSTGPAAQTSPELIFHIINIQKYLQTHYGNVYLSAGQHYEVNIAGNPLPKWEL